MTVTAHCIREGYWDERIEKKVFGDPWPWVIYKFNWFTRHLLRLIHGAETELPKRG
jgi:hypothetical protein